MKIAIDALGINMVGGGRFTSLKMIEGILEEDNVNEYLIILTCAEPDLYRFSNAKQWLIPEKHRFAVRLKAQAILPWLLHKEKVDIIHFTKNLGTFFVPCKSIVTVYDLTILKYPDFFPRVDVIYWRTLQACFLRWVGRIGALSESTRRDLVNYYGTPTEKIDVVYSAYDPGFRLLPKTVVDETRSRYGLPSDFILSVGNVSPKKNYETLVKALQILRHEYQLSYPLVIAGREYWPGGRRNLQALINQLDLENEVMFLGEVVGEDLVALYNAARLFAFPSLDEGFGIVLAEAMAAGVPVISSNTSAIPEVVGQAGILLENPLDHKELAAKMALVLTDATLRDSLIERGFHQARKFSWRKAGREYLKIYDKMIKSS
ncbi:MAG: glycosyltransferase family 4 protein [Chloroflexi bacterium]|nr:glycosyltransferase family 4 protein [Chloroflexota bacterium]